MRRCRVSAACSGWPIVGRDCELLRPQVHELAGKLRQEHGLPGMRVAYAAKKGGAVGCWMWKKAAAEALICAA